MAGYDGPSIYNKHANQRSGSNGFPFQKADSPSVPESKKSSSSFEQSSGKIVKGKKASLQSTRSSTPFQVRKVPSPYYGLHPRPKKKEKTVDYGLLKSRLKKEDTDFLLFEGYTKKAVPLSIRTKNTKPAKRKSGLSKSLSGIIQDEQYSMTSKDKTMSSLFSTHVLDISGTRAKKE